MPIAAVGPARCPAVAPGACLEAGTRPARYGLAARIFNILALLLLVAGPATADEKPRIVALGDSLTAGYGLPDGDAFTTRLQARLADLGHPAEVVNAGVSGDTTAGGLARLGWSLDGAVDLVIVELGANDGLRGIDPAETRRNLDAILAALAARKVPTLLAGMLAPPNLGTDYGNEFNMIYPELAEKYDVPLYPFFLDGVAADPALNQADGMHPNAAGVQVIVDRLAPYVIRALGGE